MVANNETDGDRLRAMRLPAESGIVTKFSGKEIYIRGPIFGAQNGKAAILSWRPAFLENIHVVHRCPQSSLEFRRSQARENKLLLLKLTMDMLNLLRRLQRIQVSEVKLKLSILIDQNIPSEHRQLNREGGVAVLRFHMRTDPGRSIEHNVGFI